MTKEQKQLRKHKRCEKRRNKNNSPTIQRYMQENDLSFSQARSQYKNGYFYTSYGKIMQVCNWEGCCDYPCNGDC